MYQVITENFYYKKSVGVTGKLMSHKSSGLTGLFSFKKKIQI